LAAFKPAYLIHGDDHGRVGERRARLRTLAEAEGGSVENANTPQDAAALLSALTLSIGRRFVIADDVERWSEADVKEHLVGALEAIPEHTTIAFFAREEGRFKAPPSLQRAVSAAGGDVAAEVAVKEWDLPKWVLTRAAELRLTLDPLAARALVHAVGPRQARLSRELEKLAIECGPGARIDADAVHERVARAGERKAWSLADALVARDGPAATRLYLQLRAQGERVEALAYWMTRRLREALGVALAFEDGADVASVRASLRMPPKVATAFIKDVQRTDVRALRRALAAFADLELDSRGRSMLDADTLAIRTIERVAA
jgi:DNA polymerase-3 subunit delta